jgi:hypothetical protein
MFVTFPFGTLQARVLSELVKATGGDIRAAEWSPGIPIAVVARPDLDQAGDKQHSDPGDAA